MILVTGATGNVGRELVEQLAGRGERVRALTRHPEAVDLPAGVEPAGGSPSDTESLERALDGVDAVFVNPTGDIEPVVRALSSTPVGRVVLLSSICVQTRDDLALSTQLRETEERVRSVHRDLVSLRPSQFMSNSLWWKPMIETGQVDVPFPDVALPIVDPADIAGVAATALLDDAYAGQGLVITGSELVSPRDEIGVLADVLDRPLEVGQQSEDEFRAAQSGVSDDEVDYQLVMTGSPSEPELELSPVVATLTGRQPRSFRDWAERREHDFR